MLSKCLNPRCSAILHNMGQGRLYRVDFTEAGKKSSPVGKTAVASILNKSCPIEHFWLCENCAKGMTIALSNAGEIHLVPLDGSAMKPSTVRSLETDKRRVATAS